MALRVPDSRRQYAVAAAVFVGLLLAVFTLFAELLALQLSRSYLEDVLLSGRVQAEEMAGQLHGEGPLYKVVESRREALSRLSAALSRQEVVESVKVYDERGKLVWQTQTRTEGVAGGFPTGESELVTPPSEPRVVETSNSYEIRVPLEDIGTVVFTNPPVHLLLDAAEHIYYSATTLIHHSLDTKKRPVFHVPPFLLAAGKNRPYTGIGVVMSMVVTFVIMLVFWIFMSGLFDPWHFGLGLVSCALVSYMSHDLLFPDFNVRIKPREIGRFLQYLPWLLYQIYLANIYVVKLALSPRMDDKLYPHVSEIQNQIKTGSRPGGVC